MSLAVRSLAPERMDGPMPPAEFAAVLADLAQVNGITRARPPTLAFVGRALRRVPRGETVTILDVGYGDGDMLRALARRLRGRAVRLWGTDIDPRSEPAARARTPAALGIRYATGDARAIPGEERIDLIVSSLVTHHMRDEEIVDFLRWMEARAARGWFVNDLHRSGLAQAGFRLLAAVAHWHPVVRHDGALSVARSFRRADWERLIADAGLDRRTVRLRWHLPFRWCLSRVR